MGHRSAFYYDNKRNLTCVLDPDNGFTYFEYDAINRQTSVKSPWGEVTYYEYTPGGEVSKRILGNDCLTYYEHDGVGRTSKVDNRKSDLTLISSYEYQRNKVGSPVSVLRNDGWAVYYEYDRKHQLTKETQRDDQGTDIYGYEWTYDLAGNRTQQVFNGVTTDYSYNASNELTHEITEAVPTYYQYDGCGNQTAKQEGAGTTYYQYDYENLMTQIDFPDGSHNYFQYDADGKRTSKGDSEGYTEFIYQGPNMLALMQERDESENTVVQYTSGLGLENMRRDTGSGMASGDSSFFHYDALGSTQELTDENETVTDTYRYNAWGQILTRTGTTTNPHTYVGKERYYLTPDPVLYLLGLRYYFAHVARFVSRDPVQRSSRNTYTYAINRPGTATDAMGLDIYMPGPLPDTGFCPPGQWWVPGQGCVPEWLVPPGLWPPEEPPQEPWIPWFICDPIRFVKTHLFSEACWKCGCDVSALVDDLPTVFTGYIGVAAEIVDCICNLHTACEHQRQGVQWQYQWTGVSSRIDCITLVPGLLPPVGSAIEVTMDLAAHWVSQREQGWPIMKETCCECLHDYVSRRWPPPRRRYYWDNR